MELKVSLFDFCQGAEGVRMPQGFVDRHYTQWIEAAPMKLRNSFQARISLFLPCSAVADRHRCGVFRG
jgi:hypothetical protein